jgi:hypothetical protein
LRWFLQNGALGTLGVPLFEDANPVDVSDEIGAAPARNEATEVYRFLRLSFG